MTLLPSTLSEVKEKELLKEFIDEETGEILYPESDGQPMSESTAHFQWITTIQGGLDSLFSQQTDVFVAGDLLWYPVKGKPYIRVAPDIMVAFGRPKGQRSSYEQWNEENIPPQVVVEILSKGNSASDMMDKFLFYEKYGVEEYYIYDYLKHKFYASIRKDNRLEMQPIFKDFISPLLGVKFDVNEDELRIYNLDNTQFLTYVQQDQARKEAMKREEEALEQKEEAMKREEEAVEREAEAMQREEAALKREEAALKEIAQLKALLNKNS